MSNAAGATGGELNLAAEEGEPNPAQPPAAKPYDPSQDREETRGNIAMLLMWLLIGVICLLAIGVFSDKVQVTDLDKMTASMLTPIVGLVGTVLGFYFGEKSR